MQNVCLCIMFVGGLPSIELSSLVITILLVIVVVIIIIIITVRCSHIITGLQFIFYLHCNEVCILLK